MGELNCPRLDDTVSETGPLSCVSSTGREREGGEEIRRADIFKKTKLKNKKKQGEIERRDWGVEERETIVLYGELRS